LRNPLPPIAAIAIAIALSIAIAAPMAQARSHFTVPAAGTLEGERKGSDRFVVSGNEMACGELTYATAYTNVVEPSSPSLEIMPEFSQCIVRALTGLRADFFQEACYYRLYDLKADGSGGWNAQVGIDCKGEYTAIGWDLFETEAKYRESHQICSTRIPEGPGAGTAEVRNLSGTKGIEVRWRLRDLDYELYTLRGVGSSLLCGSLAGKTGGEASYTGTATISSLDLFSRPQSLQVTG